MPQALAHPLGRRAFAAALGALALPGHASGAADAWPSRPVKIIAPVPPGGATDRMARLLAHEYGKIFRQSFVVDNRGGGGGGIGTAVVAKAPADGYTLLLTGVFNTINASLLQQPFDYLQDFVHIASAFQGPNVLVVRPDFPAKTVAELVALAKAEPGKIDFASAGNGTSGHLTMEIFQRAAGIRLTHIAYKGGGPALQDVLSGVAPMLATNQDTLLPHVRAGKLRALAVTSEKRNPAYPDVPSFVECGYPDLVVTSWGGLDAPRGTPAAIVERLNAATTQAMQMPELRRQVEAEGWEVFTGSPASFDAFVRDETRRWGRIIQSAGIRAS
jgi:tripartite-type tricarboxylate transporter receptor subunit TctC